MSSEPVQPAAPRTSGASEEHLVDPERSDRAPRRGCPSGACGCERCSVSIVLVSVTALGARPDRAQAAAGDVVAYLAGRQTMT